MSIEDIEDELTSSIRNIKLLLPNMSKEVESEFDTMENNVSNLSFHYEESTELSDYSDYEIEEEYETRGLSEDMYQELAEKIRQMMNLRKNTSKEVRELIENITGKLVFVL